MLNECLPIPSLSLSKRGSTLSSWQALPGLLKPLQCSYCFNWSRLKLKIWVMSALSVYRGSEFSNPPFAKLARSSMDGSLISPALGRRLISLVNLVTVTLASGRKCLTKWLSVKLGLMTSPLISCRSVMVGLKHDYWSLGTATGRHRQCQETDKSGLFSAWSPQ